MRSNLRKFASILTALTIFFSVAIQSGAVTYASDYFWRTRVWATKQGGGEFIIEYDIIATEFMDDLGASVIFIMEEQPDGEFENVYTFRSSDMPELIEHDVDVAYGCVTYEGTPGTRYYATFGLYAKNSQGNETRYFDTNTITA